MINVVAFVGTAIRDGLVSRMCNRVLEGAADAGASTELVNLYDHEIEHCIGCWSCYREGTCFHDDDFEALFTNLRDADAVVLGSSVYIGTMSGLMKTFFDRHNGLAVYNPDGASNFHRLGRLEGRLAGFLDHEMVVIAADHQHTSRPDLVTQAPKCGTCALLHSNRGSWDFCSGCGVHTGRR